jgi:chemotaxis protein methyltransferase CheR
MREARAASTGPWADAARSIEAGLGLHFPPRLWPELRRGLGAAAGRLGLPDAEACARRIAAGRIGPAEQEIVAECLTVGESYFFRDAPFLEQLARQVLQPLIAERRQRSRHLRLWSAGCASGEEPYSLAMLLAAMLPDWREWSISILATDVNGAALERARIGAYGSWSLRHGIPPQYAPFFQAGSDGRQYVDPSLRRLVRFAALNLASPEYPSVQTQTTAMDLVLCRNVLIYFEPGRVPQVLARLGRALAPQGWLVTGPVELPPGGVPGLAVTRKAGLFALRLQPPPASEPAAAPAPAPAPAPLAAATPSLEAEPPAVAASPEPPPATLLEEARRQANLGDLPAGERLCREAMRQDKLDPGASYLLATILMEAGARVDAIAALRRTLYLDPRHVLARFALGRLELAEGRSEQAQRHLARALAQLEEQGCDEVLAGSGGLTARELRDAIRRLRDAS